MFGVKGKDHPSYGIPKSEEHKKKLSEASNNKGKNNPMYGRKHTIEARRKQSDIKKGITWENRLGKNKADKRRKETKKRMSGENHFNWKGGLTNEGYCEKWRTKDLKEHIMERDIYKCQNPQCCNNTDKLCVHHINYNKKDCDPWNLITLCFSCNSIANYQRDWWECFYNEIIRRKGIYR